MLCPLLVLCPVLTSSNSTHMLNNTVIVNVHGPRVLRHSHTGKYWCSGRSINQRTVNISWTLPNGFRRVSSASGAWNSITVQNVNAEADSRVKLACTVTESSAGYVLPLSKGFLVVQSQGKRRDCAAVGHRLECPTLG